MKMIGHSNWDRSEWTWSRVGDLGVVLVDLEWSDEQENLCIGPVLSSQC